MSALPLTASLSAASATTLPRTSATSRSTERFVLSVVTSFCTSAWTDALARSSTREGSHTVLAWIWVLHTSKQRVSTLHFGGVHFVSQVGSVTVPSHSPLQRTLAPHSIPSLT